MWDRSDGRSAYRAGRWFAPVVQAFVSWAGVEAAKASATTLFFLSREGRLLAEVYSALAESDPRFGALRPHVLHVSRRSTFAASLDEIGVTPLMRLWTLYRSQSVSALLTSLNVPLDGRTLEAARARGLDPDEGVTQPWLDARVHGFLDDIAGHVASQCRAQTVALKGYLRAQGFPSDGTAVICDVGWRGSIQDNLARVFPRTHLLGLYLGLQSFLNEQPPNVTKRAFGPDENLTGIDPVLRHVTPLEFVLNSAEGSVVSYSAAGDDWRPDRVMVTAEATVFDRFTRHFQQGVLDAIREGAIPPGQCVEATARRRLQEFAVRPPVAVARAYFTFDHDERFGLGRVVEKRLARPHALMARALWSGAARRELAEFLHATSWPGGARRATAPDWLWATLMRDRRDADPLTDEARARATCRFVADFARERGPHPVCLYGAGTFAARLMRHQNLGAWDVLAVFDSAPRKWGHSFGGYPIRDPRDLTTLAPVTVVPTVYRNAALLHEITETVHRYGGPGCQVAVPPWCAA